MSQGKPLKRQVFQGSAINVAAVIGPHAVTATFLEYPEKNADKIKCKQLWKLRAMWRALHALNNNCSFQPSKLATAMTIVWEEKHDTWAVQVSDEHKDGWIASMVTRLRTALAHLSKALARGRARPALPKWLELLLMDADVLLTDSAPPESSPQPEDAEEEEGEEQEEQEGEEGEEEEVSEPDEEEDEPQPVKPVMKAKKKATWAKIKAKRLLRTTL